MPIRLLIFDWDGTLSDSGAKITRCFRAAAADLAQPPPSAAAIRRLIGLDLTTAWQQLTGDNDADRIAALTERYRQHYRRDAAPTPLFDGVAAGLRQLAADGFLLAVATGKSRAGLQRALLETALTNCFAATRCADESRSKPHPQMLHEVLTFTGQTAPQAVMIGDTTFDLDMAAHAGVYALGVGYGYHAAAELEARSDFPVQPCFAHLVSWIRRGGLARPGRRP